MSQPFNPDTYQYANDILDEHVVLITGAGLMLRSFISVQALDIGFDANVLATAEVVLPREEYASQEERLAFAQAAADAAP